MKEGEEQRRTKKNIHHGDTEKKIEMDDTMKSHPAPDRLMEFELTEKIIGAAIEVHKILGPGLLESAYQACLEQESKLRGLEFVTQVPLLLKYKGSEIDCSYRLDFIYENRVIVEIKAVDQILPVHDAQLITYLKLSGIKVGLLMNFNETVLKNGIIRRVF